VDGRGQEGSWWGQSQGTGTPRGPAPYTGPETGSQLVALRELEHLSVGQAQAYRSARPRPNSPVPARGKPSSNGERVAGRHHASSSKGDEILRQHGDKFASFSTIGGGIFVAGLLIQAVLTTGLHVNSLISYIVQAR
jgi:hypothetical protein